MTKNDRAGKAPGPLMSFPRQGMAEILFYLSACTVGLMYPAFHRSVMHFLWKSQQFQRPVPDPDHILLR